MGLLEEKYRDQSRNREVQQLVGTQSMVINALKKIHEKIDGRLHTTPSMATPWKGEFTLDLPPGGISGYSKPYNSTKLLWT